MEKLILFALALSLLSCQEPSKKVRVKPYFERPTAVIPPVIPSRPGFVNESTLEDTMNLDAQALSSDNLREKTRWVVACDYYNMGYERMDLVLMGANKFFNTISKGLRPAKLTPIGSAQCIYRLNLDDFGISDANWELIENVDLVDIESLNIRNENLQFLTQTRKPYIFLSSLVTSVMEGDELSNRNCATYCTIVDQPIQRADFLRKIGVNVQREYDEERALYEANSTSLIANGKTRGYEILQALAIGGWMFSSFDSDLTNPRDHFETPFNVEPANAGGQRLSDKIYIVEASEIFYSNPAGFYFTRLEDANGRAVTAAPTTIVGNWLHPLIDQAVRIADCTGCHKEAYIPVTGQLYDHVARSSAFDENEKKITRTFSNPTSFASTSTIIRNEYKAKLREIGVDPNIDDPIVYNLIKPFRARLTPEKLCSYTLLELDECLARLAGTTVSSQVYGNALNGGTIPLSTFIKGLPVFLREMLIFGNGQIN